MLKRLMGVNTSWWEFLIKFPLTMFVIMPVCMGGSFWIGMQIDAAAHIHLLKFILPFFGTMLGLFVTGLLVLAGHTKQSASEPEAKPDKPYSENLVSKPYAYSGTSVSPKASIPRAGLATPFTLGGKFIK